MARVDADSTDGGRGQLDPVGALSEIAFRLERELAPVFKVKAFRKAAAAIRDLTPADLRQRAADGRLKRMPGIGDRSLEVIQQALEGAVPGYLADLRQRGELPAGDGEDLHVALRGDLHTHSDWSDGWSPVPLMVDAARLLGREYLALTDHSPNLTIAHGLDAARLGAQLDLVAETNERHDDFLLLSGIEVDILESGELDQTPDMLDRLDVVVASVHSKLRADSRTMTTRMLRAIDDPHTNVLGHCTGRLVEGSRGTRPESGFDAAQVFYACAANGVAVEINSRPERQDPPDRLIQAALDAGCLFSIDSDAHAPGHLDFLRYGAARAAANGVPADRIVTTWPAERLLAWSNASR